MDGRTYRWMDECGGMGYWPLRPRIGGFSGGGFGKENLTTYSFGFFSNSTTLTSSWKEILVLSAYSQNPHDTPKYDYKVHKSAQVNFTCTMKCVSFTYERQCIKIWKYGHNFAPFTENLEAQGDEHYSKLVHPMTAWILSYLFHVSFLATFLPFPSLNSFGFLFLINRTHSMFYFPVISYLSLLHFPFSHPTKFIILFLIFSFHRNPFFAFPILNRPNTHSHLI